jgi:hypothetical protein
MSYRKRARRGAKMLDAKRRGWPFRVNPRRLDMNSPHMCVLGQDSGTHWEIAADRLGLSVWQAYRFGFVGFWGYPRKMAEAWKREINARRVEPPKPPPATTRVVRDPIIVEPRASDWWWETPIGV